MPHADDDEREKHNRAVLRKDVEQNLQHWLASRGANSAVKVLDRKQQTKHKEEAEERGKADRRQHADRCAD